jgi:hypothetical protein
LKNQSLRLVIFQKLLCLLSENLQPKKNLKLLMLSASPLAFLPTTHAAFGGEMRSSYFNNTPPKLKIGLRSKNVVGAKRRHKRIPAKNSRIQKVFPRSAWLKKVGSNFQIKDRTDFFE